MEEFFLRYVRERFGDGGRASQPGRPNIQIGVGDDAAVLSGSERDTVITTDLIADGTHFRSEQISPRQIGRKALAVNLSDIAAMGGVATVATVALLLPRRHGNTLWLAEELMEGIAELADAFQVAIIGGDTNVWDGKLALCITLLGLVRKGQAWTRSGARPGDRIFVTGALGGSLIGHHYSFTPRLELARQLRESYAIHAAMDITDGLALDLSRMAKASHVGALLNSSAIPITPAAHEMSQMDQRSALEHALFDGEDFELLLALSPEDADRLQRDSLLAGSVTEIGEFTDGSELVIETPEGRCELPARGYVHGL